MMNSHLNSSKTYTIKTLYCYRYANKSLGRPINDNLMQLLLAITTLKRNGANKIHIVLTYFAYARQDRPIKPYRGSSAADVMNFIKFAGADSVSVFDVHTEQTLTTAYPLFTNSLTAMNLIDKMIEIEKLDEPVVVSPDAGGVKRVKTYLSMRQQSNIKELAFAVLDKTRVEANKVDKIILLIGDIKGKDCIIVDDMIDTGVR